MLAKKASPLVVRAALVARHGERVLLARRRAPGLFGGLWEPPGVPIDAPTAARARRALASLLGGRLPALSLAGRVTHVLTHRRLEIVVLRAEARRANAHPRESAEYDAFEWADPTALGQRGLSTLARKIMAAAPPVDEIGEVALSSSLRRRS